MRTKIVCASLVTFVTLGAFIWANLSTRFETETGLPVVSGVYYFSGFTGNSRLRRSTGWPHEVWVRLNWAESDGNSLVVLEGMRPRETNFYLMSLLVNGVLGIALSTLVFTLTLAALNRQFSLRSICIVIACCALVLRFFTPALPTLKERRSKLKEARSLAQKMNTPFKANTRFIQR